MTLKRGDGLDLIDITIFKRWNGVEWVDITLCKVFDGLDWRDVLVPTTTPSSVTITANKSTVVTTVHGAGLAKSITTSAVTTTTVGGSGPYTYQWTRVSGSDAISADSETSSSTTFSAVVPRDNNYFATFRCTVTDSLSATDTVDVTVSINYFGPEPGVLL